ncbi:MAG: DUF1735 domain-containing protein [Bacteroidales bacterium]|nr:MAG: DUF1735 domain-containing protein [Bacteroidales bacterium]
MKKSYFILLIILAVFSACENQDWEFPDFDYSTVYFAYQSPVRTIVLGEDYIFDNSLDNEHKCLIMATIGGVYENKQDITIDVVVDNSLCENLRFGNAAGDSALAMPASYYSLPQNMQIVIPSGELMGGIEVQLTDAFFEDSLSIKNTYVIPIVITSVTNADSVLSGQTDIDTADRRIDGEWNIVPKDYVLYAIKYINPWHASYLRRGIDVVKGNNGNTALDNTIVYHEKYVEEDEVCSVKTTSMNGVSISLKTKNKDNTDLPFELLLEFDNEGRCTISNPPSASYNTTGEGEYVENGDMWGGEERDVLYLNYTIDFGTATHSLTDTLVMRDRGIKFQTFIPFVAQ